MDINGKELHKLVERLFPLCRSVSSPDNYTTLKILNEVCDGLEVSSHPVGQAVYDWVIPPSWELIEAKICSIDGEVLISTHENNLHVLNYSQAFSGEVSLADLERHLFTDTESYEAIPYVTSYYSKNWGMCVSQSQLENVLRKYSKFKVNIDVSFHKDLGMPYGEIYIKGKTKSEILFSTYICHPSMANNELSGPVITAYLARFLRDFNPYYSYRIIFVTETIGSIAYISKNYEALRENVLAGFILTCIGDDGPFSYMQSPEENSLSDQLITNFFTKLNLPLKKYSFLERGSDERQFNAYPLDLGVGGIMRSKYGEYAEYHSSLDDLKFVTASGLKKTFDTMVNFIKYIESQPIYIPTVYLEPMLSKRGLFASISHKNSQVDFLKISNVVAYSNGKRTIDEIASKIELSLEETSEAINTLLEHNLLKRL